MPDPYLHMQHAVDIVARSEHPHNKIAALLTGEDREGSPYSLAYTNFWPEKIKSALGTDARIGSASGTVHAETACVMNAPGTGGASLYITDPFCPNCAKNVVEAGVGAVYIDHKGFEKDFASRRIEYFEKMSLKICERAGVPVRRLWRKERRTEELSRLAGASEHPAHTPLTRHKVVSSFNDFVREQMETNDMPFAAGITTDPLARVNFAVIATRSYVTGFDEEYAKGNPEPAGSKYNYFMEPTARMLINAAREGLHIDHGHIFSSRVPTGREMVNMAGVGVARVIVGDINEARDRDSLDAMKTMEENGIIRFECL